jgi:hypothetical protein
MVNTNATGQVEKYLGLFQEIRGRVSDDQVARAILAEVAKDRRMEEIRQEREQHNSDPATAKQLQYLKNLGVETRPGLTKKEASVLIDEAIQKDED